MKGFYLLIAIGFIIIFPPADAFAQRIHPALSIAHHNPMLMNMPTRNSQAKGTGTASRLIGDWSADATLGAGGYYVPFDSNAYTYSNGRGGAPVQLSLGGTYGSFYNVDLPYDVDYDYNDYNNGTFSITEKYLQAFDAQNHILSNTEQSWNGSSFDNFYRTVFTYNSGNQLTGTQQQWNTSTSAWVNQFQDSFLYNVVNQRTAHYYRVWDDSLTHAWHNSFRETYTYDGAGNRIIDLHQFWRAGTSAWIDWAKAIYSYNALHQLVTETYQGWDSASASWKFTRDATHGYNSSNQQISIVDRDSIGFHASGLYHNVDSTVNISLNAAGYPLTTVVYGWQSNSWINFKRFIETYNSNNQVISEYGTHWNGSSWVIGSLDYAYRYYYETYAEGVANSISRNAILNLYPNPAKEMLSIDLTSQQSEANTVTIYDGAGRSVLHWQIPSSVHSMHQLNISSLPSGVYWLRLSNESGTLSRSFSIRH